MQLLPKFRLRDRIPIRSLRQARRRRPINIHVHLSMYPLPSIIMHERDIRKVHATVRRRRRKNNARYPSVPFSLPSRSSFAHARALGIRTQRAVVVRRGRRGRWGAGRSGGGRGFLGGIPFETGFDHEVDGVAGFDGIFFEEFGVGQGFAFEEEALGVRGGCAGLGGEEGFEGGDGVGGVYGEGYGEGGFEGFEDYLDGFCGYIEM